VLDTRARLQVNFGLRSIVSTGDIEIFHFMTMEI
jgi:hypothetical protein